MTANGRPGRLVVGSRAIGELDLFARGAGDWLVHLRQAGLGEWTGEELSPGEHLLVGDPTVAVTKNGSLHVFARTEHGHLLHWRLPSAGSGEPAVLAGPIDHQWHAGYDPVAVGGHDGESVFVYARGTRDQLLRWQSQDGETWQQLEVLDGTATGQPAVIQRNVKTLPEVFARGRNGVLTWWTTVRKDPTTLEMIEVALEVSDLQGPDHPTDPLVGDPLVVSWDPDRLDVVAPGLPLAPGDGPVTLHHWGHRDLNNEWYGADESSMGAVAELGAITTTAKDHAEVFARDTNGGLVRWYWEGDWYPTNQGWLGPDPLPVAVLAQPAALLIGTQSYVYAWVDEGTTLAQVHFDLQKDAWVVDRPNIVWETPAPADVLQLPGEVDVLLTRAADLLRVGVSWSGYAVADGDPPRLVPTASVPERLLRLVLPPQHIGEETTTDGAPAPVPGDEHVWSSIAAGPSQLTFTMPEQDVELTVEGVLDAVRQGTVRGLDADTGELNTFVELPWQLFLSPDGATVAHPSSAQPAAGGTTTNALWRTVVTPPDGAGMVRRAGAADPFDLPLPAAQREAIAAAGTPAAVTRMELTGLGGTLTARGDWDGLSWDHAATLGRDERVHVVQEGRLYPYGHRARLELLTDRHLDVSGERVAVLHRQQLLTVTEPTRSLPADEQLARAFPFDDVTITTRVFRDFRPSWTTGTRKAKPPPELQAELDALVQQLGALPDTVPGWDAAIPDEAVVVFVDDPARLPSVDPATAAEARLGQTKIDLLEAIQEIREKIATNTQDQTIPLFATLGAGTGIGSDGSWLDFPVTATVHGTPVSFVTPMIFVADQQLPQTDLLEAFDTMVDGDAPELVQRAWASLRGTPPAAAQAGSTAERDQGYAGVIKLPGQPLDLVGSGCPDDTLPVNRIHVSAQALERDFRARLGPAADLAADLSQPGWGVDVNLPALRGLLPDRPEVHRVVTNLSQEFLTSGPVAEVLHDVVGPAEGVYQYVQGELTLVGGPDLKPLSELAGVVVDFTKDADRSGGLVSPKVVATGLSRLVGPVNVDGLKSLDPGQLFDGDATLLGFPLSSLLAGLDRSKLPTITTDLTGAQPVVTMIWPPVPPGAPADPPATQPLKLSAPFGPGADPTTPPSIRLLVHTAGTDVRTECTVSNFSLSFPEADPLVTLTFQSVRYVQEAGHAPNLEVHGLSAKFDNELDLLQSLEEKIGLGNQGPTITVDQTGIVASYKLAIPEAGSTPFSMRNLAFAAAVHVPFQGDPVLVEIGFATKAAPFNLSVMMFGGGGYVDLAMNYKGLQRLDIALEFGASVQVDFVIAQGEAHVLGGIHFELQDSRPVLAAYLRIGGSLEVLGLVTVSVELVLSLTYTSQGNRLVGRATLVIDVDLTICSDKVELDSGEWVILGGDPTTSSALPGTLGAHDGGLDPYLALAREHRAAFQDEED